MVPTKETAFDLLYAGCGRPKIMVEPALKKKTKLRDVSLPQKQD